MTTIVKIFLSTRCCHKMDQETAFGDGKFCLWTEVICMAQHWRASVPAHSLLCILVVCPHLLLSPRNRVAAGFRTLDSSVCSMPFLIKSDVCFCDSGIGRDHKEQGENDGAGTADAWGQLPN